MSTLMMFDIQTEAELIERFVTSYRKRFASAIDELNRQPASARMPGPELQCLRLCVETMDMLLSNQDRLARSMRRLAEGTPSRRVA
jgi:hypothetical protein